MSPKKKSEVQEIIEKSGNTFHSRVVKLLRDEKWAVLVSPYYNDNFTDKPREIDIIAEKKINISGPFEKWVGTVNVRLFIECKYITRSIVFWFDDKDKERAIERAMKDTGLEHPNRNAGLQTHHYLADTPVAKLFASSKNLGDEHDVFHKAINQNLNAMVYYRNKSNLIPTKRNEKDQALRRVCYPIIVCNSFDGFHQTKMADGANKAERLTEPFQLEVNYAYLDSEKSTRSEYFLIDVMAIEKLAGFLSELENADIQPLRDQIFLESMRQ